MDDITAIERQQSTNVVPCAPPDQRILAWVAETPGKQFARRELMVGPLAAEQIEVTVESCGLCASDLAMWRNQWQRSRYPFVGGHEIIGRVSAVGMRALGVTVGQRVGLGWYSGSCLICHACRAGHLHQCQDLKRLIIDGHGGFAERVRTHWAWAFPVPESLPSALAGPLFCGGITVFSPIAEFVHATHRVAVVGVGGLGHLALQFLNRFGCEVTAFVEPGAAVDEASTLGAHHVLPSDSSAADLRRAGPFDFILVTTAAPIDLAPFAQALAHRGRLHVLGVGCAPLAFSPDLLMPNAAQVSASAIGSPGRMLDMLAFAARHSILPQVESFPMSSINDAFERLASGKARYRIVMQAEAR